MTAGNEIRAACETIIRHYTAALTPGKAKTETIRSTAIEAATPLPLAVLNARGMATIHLAKWASVVTQERSLHTAPTRYDTLALARFVALHSDWLGNHAGGDLAAKELTAISRELADVATGVVKPARIPVGPCVDQQPDGEGVCAGRLTAHMTPPAVITCDTNATHEWPSSRWPNLRLKMARLDPNAAAELVARLSNPNLT